MGSLLQASQMAAEHAGFSSPLKSESAVSSGKRRGRMGHSDAGDSESELEAEEDERDEVESELEKTAAAASSRKGKGKEMGATGASSRVVDGVAVVG